MPGADKGRIIENKILNLDAPSMYAASSISFGIILKKAFNIHTANGEAKVTFIIMRAKYEFKRPILLSIRYIGINKITPGNAYVTNKLCSTN